MCTQSTMNRNRGCPTNTDTLAFTMSSDRNLDKGWAWVILFAAFFSYMLHGILVYVAGVTHVALLQEFKESDTMTSFVGSVYLSLVALAGPLTSVLMNTTSCRITSIIGGLMIFLGLSCTFFAESLIYVLFTYSVITGIGNGLNATPSLVSIGYYFYRKRSFAIGVTVSGAGVGMLISGPLFQALIDTYGFRGACLILGGIGANHIVFGLLMKPSKTEKRQWQMRKNNTDYSKKKHLCETLKGLFHFSILKDKTFLIILIQFLVWNIPLAIVILHLPNFAVTQGASKDSAAFLIFVVGLTGTIGRVLCGMSVGPENIDPILMNLGLTGIAGIATLLFPLYSLSYIGQCVFAALFGLYSGGLTSLITPLIVEILDLSKLSTAVGVMFFTGGLGSVIGPTFAGIIIDNGYTYLMNFYISGILLVISSFLTLLSTLWRKEIPKYGRKLDTDHPENSTFITQSGILAGSMILNLSIQKNMNMASETEPLSVTVTKDAINGELNGISHHQNLDENSISKA